MDGENPIEPVDLLDCGGLIVVAQVRGKRVDMALREGSDAQPEYHTSLALLAIDFDEAILEPLRIELGALAR